MTQEQAEAEIELAENSMSEIVDAYLNQSFQLPGDIFPLTRKAVLHVAVMGFIVAKHGKLNLQ